MELKNSYFHEGFTPSLEDCVRQMCVFCLEDDDRHKELFCTDVSCPLWLYFKYEEVSCEDCETKTAIYLSIARKILAEK